MVSVMALLRVISEAMSCRGWVLYFLVSDSKGIWGREAMPDFFTWNWMMASDFPLALACCLSSVW